MGFRDWLYRNVWNTGFTSEPATAVAAASAAGPIAADLPRPQPLSNGAPLRSVLVFDLSTLPAAYNVGIVGESYRQTAIRKVSGGRRQRGEHVTFTAVLSPEPNNSYDPNAVMVHANGADQLGYLSAEDAVAYKPVFDALMAAGKVGLCHAKLIGGTPGKPSMGVVISLDEPTALLARFATDGELQPF